MDYIRFLNESFDYTKEALWGRWVRWLLLLIASILFPFIYGYSVRVMSGTKPAPEPEGWIGLFIDGIKVIIISLVYTIPVYVLAAVSLLAYFVPVSSTTTPGTGPAPGLGPELGIVVVLAILVLFIVATIVCGILATFGVARFSRTGRMGDAFRIGVLRDHIGRVGWLDVFIALVVLTVVFAIAEFVLMFIPVIGWFLLFLLTPAFIIFASRYIALVYESAPAPA
jgi:hypothetical protein